MASANLQEQRAYVQLLTAEFEAGRLRWELYLEAVTAWLDLVGDKLKDTKTFAEEMGLAFTSALEDALVAGKGFKDLLNGIGRDILRISTRKLVTEPIGGSSQRPRRLPITPRAVPSPGMGRAAA